MCSSIDIRLNAQLNKWHLGADRKVLQNVVLQVVLSRTASRVMKYCISCQKLGV